jgi:hypothetical protein
LAGQKLEPGSTEYKTEALSLDINYLIINCIIPYKSNLKQAGMERSFFDTQFILTRKP